MAVFSSIFNGPYIPPFRPLSNITPFTYRDGSTYLEVLEELRTYLNDDLVAFVNENFGALDTAFTEEVTRLITEVETALTEQSSSVATQLSDHTDEINVEIANLTSFVNSAVSDANAAVDAANAAVAAANASLVEVNSIILANNNQMNELQLLVENAVDTVVNESITVQDDVIAGVIADEESDTRTILDGLYSVTVLGDSTIQALVEDPGSLTRLALDVLYAVPAVTPETLDPSVETLIEDTESLTRIALQAIVDAAIATIDIVSDASQITTGTFNANRIPNLENLNGVLSVTKGGTGGNSKTTARTGLGFTSGTAAPNNADGNDGDFYFQEI
jgi:hypothetical protein